MVRAVTPIVVLGLLAGPTARAQDPLDAVRTWARAKALPLETIDPAAPLDDLAPLARIVGPARVVGSGESEHHRHEFLVLRTRVLRFLVERLGFTALAMETGYADADRLGRWVAGENDDPPDFSAGLPFAGDGDLTELRDALTWIRHHNAGLPPTRRVRFYGIDLSHGGGAIRPVLDQLWPYLQRVDSAAASTYRARLEPIADRFGDGYPAGANKRYQALSETDRTELRAAGTELLAHLRAGRARYLRAAPAGDYERAIRLVTVLRQTEEFIRVPPYGDANPRDTSLAANLRWVLQREGPRGKVVVWAHNAHVQRAPILVPGLNRTPVVSMGQLLARSLGRGYVALGTTFDRREADTTAAGPATLDGVLASVGRPLLLVDLRSATGSAAAWLRSPQRMRFQTLEIEVSPAGAFDAVIFVSRSSPAKSVAGPG